MNTATSATPVTLTGTMTREQAIAYLKSKDNVGQVIPIVFLKGDGTERKMNVLIGGDPTVLVNNPMKIGKPKPEGVVGVYDNDIKQYRSFNNDKLLSVTIGGVTHSFKGTP
jgi:hypothetical protein